MDYLKFLGLSLLAILALFLEVKVAGVGLATFVVAGITIGLFARRASRRHTIAYVAWTVLMLGWIIFLARVVKAQLVIDPEQAGHLRIGEGFLVLLAMIFLHPLCYGIARLMTRNQAPATPKSV